MKFTISKTSTFSTHIIYVAKEDARYIPDFEAGKNDVTVRYEGKKAVVYCGIGEKDKVTLHILRSASARGIQKVIELKHQDVSVIVPRGGRHGGEPWAAVVMGIVLGAYRYAKYKSEKKQSVSAVELVGEGIVQRSVGRLVTIGECVNYCRDLVNENASVANPEFLAEEARAIARRGGMSIDVLTEKEIDKKGLALLKAVGQGSPFPPRLAILQYKGNPGSKDSTAIVGKGITFDSGGQNLKSTGHIETMRCDMAGAAAVLGIMKALGELKPRVNVTGVCALAHNAIGERSFFPGDVYKSYSGKTVEINSTDAEGRLVLADAISYCKAQYSPACIIDLATLTGGILASLGPIVAGLFANDENLAKRLFAAGEETNERLWRFPLYEEYGEAMKSDIADLRNVGKWKKGYASSIIGAAFIGEFAKPTPWAHIDIAGTAFNEDAAQGEIPQFATGFGVRLLLRYLGIE
jgi:leucyl aminopeptidase